MSAENFRSCYGTTIDCSEHLTLLVGENDAGKELTDPARIEQTKRRCQSVATELRDEKDRHRQ